jgi:hypothetical protein
VWERSFVAVSMLVGGSLEDALEALPSDARPLVAELEAKLRDGRRPVRATGLAVVAHEVALAIGEVTLQ